MAFQAEGREVILARLIEAYKKYRKNNASEVEGTFAFDDLAANSVEFQNIQAEMELLIEAMFPQSSWGEYLDLLADELGNGMKRRAATKAVVVLTLSGTAGTEVNSGALFATDGKINFITTEDCTIGEDGFCTVKAEAQAAGKEGNVKAGTIVKIPVSIYGVSAVTNKEDAYNGYDEETDDSLRERLLFRLRHPVTSGNANEYVDWAESVGGVGAAKCIPLWNGNGTVKVIIVDANNEQANDELLNAVKNYIEKVRPIGASVTVVTPEILKVSVAAKVTAASEDYVAKITEAINEYFRREGFNSNYVSIAHIGKIMLETGAISDYESLTINGGISNISVDDNHVPRLGTLTLEVK